MSKIQRIITNIRILENELALEIQKKEQDFFYKIKGRKVLFEKVAKEYHKKMAMKIHSYFYHASIANILTAPIIWSCLVPALFMDLVITFYQAICFRVYGIPRVPRADFIVIDRHRLMYLNVLEKINCVYCEYFNGLIGYVMEIAGRTEQFWCPIKHARKIRHFHSRYRYFMEFGDADLYRRDLENLRSDFKDLEN